MKQLNHGATRVTPGTARPGLPSEVRVPDPATQRKRYSPPVLIAYGSLSDLTRFVGNDFFDGAIGSRQTT